MKNCPACGENLSAPKSRSGPQLRRYFAGIKAAFNNWPESHQHQFVSSEELRAWIQMKAGAREVGAQIQIRGMNKDRAMMLVEAAIGATKSFAWPEMHGDTLVVFRPKSISFAKMKHEDFCRLSDAVFDVIASETGISQDDLLQEAAE